MVRLHNVVISAAFYDNAVDSPILVNVAYCAGAFARVKERLIRLCWRTAYPASVCKGYAPSARVLLESEVMQFSYPAPLPLAS